MCFFNFGFGVSGCEGVFFVFFLYVVVNMVFNISFFSLLKYYFVIVFFFCVILLIFFVIWVFILLWFYLGVLLILLFGFFLGVVIFVMGFVMYSLLKFVEQEVYWDQSQFFDVMVRYQMWVDSQNFIDFLLLCIELVENMVIIKWRLWSVWVDFGFIL